MHEDILFFPAVKDLPVHISIAGISYCDGGYHIRRSTSSVTVIEYIVKGEGYVTVNGIDTLVSADNVYILRKGEAHNYYSSAEQPWEKIFINLEGSLPLTLLEQYHLSGQWLFNGDGMKDIFLQVADIVRQKSNDLTQEIALASLFFQAVARLGHSHSRSSYSQEAIQMKDYLDHHTDRIIGNQELADSIFRSPDYCVKLFNREYGVTPYAYQLSEKMNIARRLLRDSAMPITHISSSLGYHDPCYFSGLFKRMCGCSPREYRYRTAGKTTK